MSLLAPPDPKGPLSPQFVYGFYLPSAVLVGGVALIDPNMLPYALLASTILGGMIAYGDRTVPVLNTRNYQKFELQEKRVISHNVAMYRFKLPTRGSILGLPIGQHIQVQAKIEGKDCSRSYTPISSDENRGYFDLLIKSYPTGRLSKHMGEMELGQTLEVRGPKGAMVYNPKLASHIGMIAGGTGITPMLQIIRAINRNRPYKGGRDVTRIDLIFANVNQEDILLKDDLDKLAKEDDLFSVHYVLNNAPEGWTGDVGFVTPEIIKAKLPAPSKDVKILICGPPPMVKAMEKATEEVGFDKPTKPMSKLPDQVFLF